jgi:hypothetical protein
MSRLRHDEHDGTDGIVSFILSCNCVIFEYSLQGHLVMDLAKLFWYPIAVEGRQEMVTV